MAFIRKARASGRRSDCFFCRYVREPRRDRANLVLRRGPTCFAMMNLYPYTSGHLLAAPLAHKAEPADLRAEERAELFGLLVDLEALLTRTMHPHGFNIGLNLGEAAGAGVPGHLHFHIVPRWRGDANFMSAVGNAKVIPQSLRDLHALLQKGARKRR